MIEKSFSSKPTMIALIDLLFVLYESGSLLKVFFFVIIGRFNYK